MLFVSPGNQFSNIFYFHLIYHHQSRIGHHNLTQLFHPLDPSNTDTGSQGFNSCKIGNHHSSWKYCLILSLEKEKIFIKIFILSGVPLIIFHFTNIACYDYWKPKCLHWFLFDEVFKVLLTNMVSKMTFRFLRILYPIWCKNDKSKNKVAFPYVHDKKGNTRVMHITDLPLCRLPTMLWVHSHHAIIAGDKVGWVGHGKRFYKKKKGFVCTTDVMGFLRVVGP